jgi:glyoxylase-like metal-dependent hydrolase (beta-lactamase superfamily II)
MVFAHNPGPWTGPGSNSWLIEGRRPTLVDAGSGDQRHLDELAAALDESGSSLDQVLVTHAHNDHAGGAPSLATRWPSATFAKYPWPDRDGPSSVEWKPLRDEELVPAGDAHLWVLHTPGHTPDHLCFFEPRSGTLFAGDLVRTGGTVVIPASHGGSLSQYLRSLTRVLELQPRRILAGHGPAIDEPVPLLRGYIAHRRARERQIVEALSSGPLAIPGIVSIVYPDLQPDLRAAAGESVLAHLRKLEEEGRVALEEGGDAIAGRWYIDRT